MEKENFGEDDKCDKHTYRPGPPLESLIGMTIFWKIKLKWKESWKNLCLEELKKKEEIIDKREELDFIETLKWLSFQEIANNIAEYLFENDFFINTYFWNLWYSLEEIQNSKIKAQEFLLAYCILLVKLNDKNDLLKFIISNSRQKWVSDWVDLSNDFLEDWSIENISNIVISVWNYEIFNILNNLWIKFKNVWLNILKNSIYKDSKEKKKNIVIDLLKSWYKPTLDDLFSFIKFWNIEILELFFKNNLIKNSWEIIKNLLDFSKLDNLYEIRRAIKDNVEVETYLYSLVVKQQNKKILDLTVENHGENFRKLLGCLFFERVNRIIENNERWITF